MEQPTTVEDLRPPLVRFAMLMERQLRNNDEVKGVCGWGGVREADLLCLLEREVVELLEAMVLEGCLGNNIVRDRRVACRRVMKEAADVANFAMMLADKYERTLDGLDKNGAFGPPE